jgi:two-component system nitrate/nitrite response regulator NarL
LLEIVVAESRAARFEMKASRKGAQRDALPGPVSSKAIISSAGGPNPVRILVVDDHPIVRRGLCSCLANYKHLLVVGEAGNGKEAITKAHDSRPDVVLMDIDMPKLDGLAATEVLARENPTSKVLMLCMHKDTPYALPIVRAGALGYISKEASPTELVEAIETVAAGNKFLGSTNALDASQRPKDKPPARGLSRREREVLTAVAEGFSNKEIASRLGVGVRTIETHRERIISKLKIHSTAGLTRFAISQGLISLSRDSGEEK